MEYRTDKINELKHERNEYRATSIFLVVIFAVFLIFGILNTVVFTRVRVEGNSMVPTLHTDDILYVSNFTKPDYNDIIVVDASAITGAIEEKWIIKRVIGLEGDTISFSDGYVFRNGEKLTEDYGSFGETYAKEGVDTYTVKSGEIYFLGDNRSISHDSRYSDYRSCKTENVIGVVPKWSVSVKSVNNFLYELFLPINEFFWGKI